MPLPVADDSVSPEGRARVFINAPAPDALPMADDTSAAVTDTKASVLDKLLGTNGQERYQLWPERLVRDALSAPHDVMNSQTPLTSQDLIKPAMDVSALAGTGGLGGAEASLGSGPFLRPALKYDGKIYKAPVGGQHMDAIPKDLQAEFTRQAMNGDDISNFNFGFMNHKGQFLDREKAMDYAVKEGLLDPRDASQGALTSTVKLNADNKAGTTIKALESPSSLNTPPIPTLENMDALSKIKNVPLDSARGTNPMDWNRFNTGDHPPPLIKGYGDLPVAVKQENGEHVVFDGHHRIVNAINNGDKNMKMHVVNTKDYAPQSAGVKPNTKQSISDDALLAQLGLK